MSQAEHDPNGRRAGGSSARISTAIVVFVDDTQVKWLRWLHRGFRHCFIVVRSGRHWIACDPLCHYTALAVLPPCHPAELISHFRQRGHSVIATTTRNPPPSLAPVRPFTCVEVVKRVLGLRAPWIFTPWQLFRHLSRGSDAG